MKVALVHDWLNQIGGAENVLMALKALFPDAPVYTSIYDRAAMPPVMRRWEIYTSFMDRLPGIYRHHQAYTPLYPLAFEHFDFSGYDLVISNKSGFCHGLVTPPGTTHLCYCLTPTRFLWGFHGYVEREGVGLAARTMLPVMTALRAWDQLAAQRPDHFVAISRAIQERIAKFYRRESVVIYPPVETDRFQIAGEVADYYFIVSRLVPYKRIDLAVRTFNLLERPLVISGEGRDRAALEAMAGPNIRFVGRLSDAELPRWMARARAFIFPGEEDFGIAPLEAQAAGRPVVAYAGGGALDTVVDGHTGTFFTEPTPQALADAVRRLDAVRLDPHAIRAHARAFDSAHFKSRLAAHIESLMSEKAGYQPVAAPVAPVEEPA
ncbi:MAG: glycosyltransferase [Ardenticatenaceae bacterium]|nr:glycosyltransferase [Ardenticatenaceae bacterium]HBY94078.1 glycosyl transferase [Chloroflexota bacterium]